MSKKRRILNLSFIKTSVSYGFEAQEKKVIFVLFLHRLNLNSKTNKSQS
jgi:hypothetical protein